MSGYLVSLIKIVLLLLAVLLMVTSVGKLVVLLVAKLSTLICFQFYIQVCTPVMLAKSTFPGTYLKDGRKVSHPRSRAPDDEIIAACRRIADPNVKRKKFQLSKC